MSLGMIPRPPTGASISSAAPAALFLAALLSISAPGPALAEVPVLAEDSAAGDTATGETAASEGSSAGAPVRYARVRAGKNVRTARFAGVVESARQATVASEVAGTVRVMRVREGDLVRAGEALAQLRRRPLELSRDAVRGRLAEAEAQLQSARLRLTRLEQLGSSSVVSPQNVDDARFELQAGEGRLAQLTAELARLEDQLEQTIPRAPFDAVVTAEHVEAGEWLDRGDPVVELTALDQLEARFDVPERHFAQLHPGMVVSVQLDARPGARTEGRLRAVVPRASEPARMFPALVRLPADPRFAVGMLVHAEVGSSSEGSLLVPRDALVHGKGAGHASADEVAVFVIGDDARARRVPVDVVGGMRGSDGTWVGVRGELNAGDRVVTRGNEGLRSGDRVSATIQETPTQAAPTQETPTRETAVRETATP